MKDILDQQYTMVRQSREVLLDYCSTLADKDFTADTGYVGRGSIRNLLVHIVNIYEFWIGEKGLKRDQEFSKFGTVRTASEARPLFKVADSLMEVFIEHCSQGKETEFEINGRRRVASYLELFTHVITHEFHHKGQILSLSRHLGYLPVDTDVIR